MLNDPFLVTECKLGVYIMRFLFPWLWCNTLMYKIGTPWFAFHDLLPMICFEDWFSRWPCIVLCIALSIMNLTALEAKSDIRWMPQAGSYRVAKHFNVWTIRIKSPLTIHFCCRSIRDSFEEKIKLLHLFFGSAWLNTESELQTQSYPDFCICSGVCLLSHAWKYRHSLLIPFGNGNTQN